MQDRQEEHKEEHKEEVEALYSEGYNVEDGNDPLAKFLDVDLDKISPEELKQLLAELSEVVNNPRALKKVISSKTISKTKADEANSLFASLGIDITI